MIVDDDIFNLRVLEIQLKELNWKCIKANNGKEAFEILKEKNKINSCTTSIKLIFMDYQMPIIDGVEAAIQINELISNNIIKSTKILKIMF